MKIVKYPDKINPNTMIEEEIKKKYGVCPFCGEKRGHEYTHGKRIGISSLNLYKRYGKQKPVWKNFFKPVYSWYIMSFTCYSCGAEWESEEFPKIEIE